MSTESLRANQLRLYFSSLAYVLVEALHLYLSLGSAARLKSPQSKNFVSFSNAQVNYVQIRPK